MLQAARNHSPLQARALPVAQEVSGCAAEFDDSGISSAKSASTSLHPVDFSGMQHNQESC